MLLMVPSGGGVEEEQHDWSFASFPRVALSQHNAVVLPNTPLHRGSGTTLQSPDIISVNTGSLFIAGCYSSITELVLFFREGPSHRP